MGLPLGVIMPKLSNRIFCPNCDGNDVRVTGTYGPRHAQLSRQLVGLNVIRRRIKCRECEGNFFTIEMIEDDFDKLKKPAGTLDTMTSLRVKGYARDSNK